MQALNLPKTELKIARKNGAPVIFDVLRRKFVALTPEEWVRQHFVHYLIEHKGYPPACVGNEISLSLNGTQKRCDTVVYDSEAQPLMIVEYKAMHIPITQRVFEQISRYNMQMHVRWLIVSNGLQHYCCLIDYQTGTYQYLPDIPDWASLCNMQ